MNWRDNKDRIDDDVVAFEYDGVIYGGGNSPHRIARWNGSAWPNIGTEPKSYSLRRHLFIVIIVCVTYIILKFVMASSPTGARR